MNVRILIGLLVACILLDAVAATPAPVPRLTGEQFVMLYFGDPNGARSTKNARKLIEHERALGYLAGVADATQGKAWCDKGRVKTIEVDAEIAHAMRKLPAGELQQEAASIILGILNERFPCQ